MNGEGIDLLVFSMENRDKTNLKVNLAKI